MGIVVAKFGKRTATNLWTVSCGSHYTPLGSHILSPQVLQSTCQHFAWVIWPAPGFYAFQILFILYVAYPVGVVLVVIVSFSLHSFWAVLSHATSFCINGVPIKSFTTELFPLFVAFSFIHNVLVSLVLF